MEDPIIVLLTEISVENATVGDTGHINVLHADEDVPQHEVDEEDVDADVVEEEMVDRYRLV